MKNTIKMTVFVHAAPGRNGSIDYVAYGCDMSEYSTYGAMIETVEVDVPFNECDRNTIVEAKVESLKAEQNKINGEAYAKTKALQDKIDSLLCIEHKEVAE